MPQRRNVVLDAIANAARMAAIINRGRVQQQGQAVREQQLAEVQRVNEEKRIRDARQDRQADEDREVEFLQSGAVRLNPAEAGFLEQERAGELGGAHVRVPIATGVSARARGQTVLRAGGEFLIPTQRDKARRDLAQDFERETKLQEAKTVPIGTALGEALGLNPTRRVPRSAVSSLATTVESKRKSKQPKDPKLQAFTGDSGEVTVANLRTGDKRSLGKIGKKGTTAKGDSRSQARLEKKDEKQAFIAAEASRIYLENGGDADQAIADIPRQASFDDTGRFSKNAVAIAKFIKTLQERPDKALEALRIIFGDDIPPELLSGGQPGTASPAAGGSATADQQVARDFLKRRKRRK